MIHCECWILAEQLASVCTLPTLHTVPWTMMFIGPRLTWGPRVNILGSSEIISWIKFLSTKCLWPIPLSWTQTIHTCTWMLKSCFYVSASRIKNIFRKKWTFRLLKFKKLWPESELAVQHYTEASKISTDTFELCVVAIPICKILHTGKIILEGILILLY